MPQLIDPENIIVKLCAAGMQAEFNSDPVQAKNLFTQAWNESVNESEKFISAHYLARHQTDPADVLKWNQEALNWALKVRQEEIISHLPSLYLNLAKSYEDLGDLSTASINYQLAADHCSRMPAGAYAETIRTGISRGLARTATLQNNIAELDQLIDSWCKRKDLKSLAAILPSYVSNLNTAADHHRIASALGFLVAVRNLPQNEQEQAERIMQMLAKD